MSETEVDSDAPDSETENWYYCQLHHQHSDEYTAVTELKSPGLDVVTGRLDDWVFTAQIGEQPTNEEISFRRPKDELKQEVEERAVSAYQAAVSSDEEDSAFPTVSRWGQEPKEECNFIFGATEFQDCPQPLSELTTVTTDNHSIFLAPPIFVPPKKPQELQPDFTNQPRQVDRPSNAVSGRYFSSGSGHGSGAGFPCALCGQIGHLSFNCFKRTLKSYRRPCLVCGTREHPGASCPLAICPLCWASDHTTVAECPQKHAIRSTRCKRCGLNRHQTAFCPDFWRLFHLTRSTHDKIVVDSKTTRSRDRLFCHNCAERGHAVFECRRERAHAAACTDVTPHVILYAEWKGGVSKGVPNKDQFQTTTPTSPFTAAPLHVNSMPEYISLDISLPDVMPVEEEVPAPTAKTTTSSSPVFFEEEEIAAVDKPPKHIRFTEDSDSGSSSEHEQFEIVPVGSPQLISNLDDVLEKSGVTLDMSYDCHPSSYKRKWASPVKVKLPPIAQKSTLRATAPEFIPAVARNIQPLRPPPWRQDKTASQHLLEPVLPRTKPDSPPVVATSSSPRGKKRTKKMEIGGVYKSIRQMTTAELLSLDDGEAYSAMQAEQAEEYSAPEISDLDEAARVSWRTMKRAKREMRATLPENVRKITNRFRKEGQKMRSLKKSLREIEDVDAQQLSPGQQKKLSKRMKFLNQKLGKLQSSHNDGADRMQETYSGLLEKRSNELFAISQLSPGETADASAVKLHKRGKKKRPSSTSRAKSALEAGLPEAAVNTCTRRQRKRLKKLEKIEVEEKRKVKENRVN